MSRHAAISVILPVRNGERYLYRAIRSVQCQTYERWELIVVDDGSTDNSATIAQRLAARDARILVVRTPAHGLVAALQHGLAKARGQFVARMDADDMMHRDRLQLQQQYLLDHPQLAVAGCLVDSFPRRRVLEGMARYQQWLNQLTTHEQITRDIFVESPLAHPSVMMRRDALLAVGGYQDNGLPEDYDLWFRFYAAGYRFGKVPQVLHFWRDAEDRLSRRDLRYSHRSLRRLKIHYLTSLFLKRTKRVQLWGAGRGGKVWARALEEFGIAVSRFIDIDPKKVGGILRGAPVCFPDILRSDRGDPLLVVVGVKGARELIRKELDRLHFTEHRDYVCVA